MEGTMFWREKIWREISFRGTKYTNGNVGIFRNINKERKLNLTIWEQSFLNLAFFSRCVLNNFLNT